MIRAAKMADFSVCKAMALAQSERYPALRPNLDSMRKLFADCVSSARNFAVVSEHGGSVVGCLLALSFDHLWAQKQTSCVLIWSCEKSGDGIQMLRNYRDWASARPAIRRAGFQFDIDIDGKILAAIERVGFVRNGGCYLQVKGV